jgi:4a-hydroxytetrahydrobiopterin dehydratase
MSADEAREQLKQVPGWQLSADGTAITRSWTRKNFMECMAFLNKVAEVAEAEQHHPDLHLTGYKNVRVALMTHAIGGLSENDFILAAKIDGLA